MRHHPTPPTAAPARERTSRTTAIALAGFAALMLVPTASALEITITLENEGCALTPGGWGAPPSGNNGGQLLHDHFDEVFGDELVVGDLVFEDAQEVTDALPYTGQGGAFMSHAVALEINLAFGNAGLLDGTLWGVTVESEDEDLDGLTAQEILAMAEDILIADDNIRNNEYSSLVDAMTGLNEERFGCHEAPDCPTNVMAVPQTDGSILVTWDAVENATEYAVYRAAGDEEHMLVEVTEDTEFLDTTTAVGQTYSYIVTAFDGVLESQDCQAVVATAIPFFPGLVVGGLAMAGSVGAFAWMRRKA